MVAKVQPVMLLELSDPDESFDLGRKRAVVLKQPIVMYRRGPGAGNVKIPTMEFEAGSGRFNEVLAPRLSTTFCDRVIETLATRYEHTTQRAMRSNAATLALLVQYEDYLKASNKK